MITDRCAHCGARITLVKTGRNDLAGHKWVTDPGRPKASWKCNPTKDFPLRSHAPKEAVNDIVEA